MDNSPRGSGQAGDKLWITYCGAVDKCVDKLWISRPLVSGLCNGGDQEVSVYQPTLVGGEQQVSVLRYAHIA